MRNATKIVLLALVILAGVKLLTDWPEGVFDAQTEKIRARVLSSETASKTPLAGIIPGEIEVAKSGNPEEHVISNGTYKNKYFGFTVPLPPLWLISDSKKAGQLLKAGPAWKPYENEKKELQKGQHILLMCTKGRIDIYGQQDNAMLFILASRIPPSTRVTAYQLGMMEMNIAKSEHNFDSLISGPEEFTLAGRDFSRTHFKIKSYVIIQGGCRGTYQSDSIPAASLVQGQRSTPILPVQCVLFSTVKDGHVLQFMLMSKNEAALAEAVGYIRRLQFDPV